MNELVETATNILNNYLKVKKDEKILIIKDEENSIVDAFKKACEEKKINFGIFKISLARTHGTPIPKALEKMKEVDIIIAPTKWSITHVPEMAKIVKLGKRAITLPGITEEIFLKIKNANFEEINELNEKIFNFMKGKNKIDIETPAGTKLSFSIKDRKWTGKERAEGEGYISNLPTGEMFCAPIEESANGIIQIDYWGDKIKPENKAWIKVKDGKIVEWSESAKPFINTHSVKNGLIIAEFGIGTNSAHGKPIGNILHDEKIYGTCHIAFGNNTGFGGKNKSEVHSDIILMQPTIIIDGKIFKI